MEKKRSKGITVIAGINQWILGILQLLGGALLLANYFTKSDIYLKAIEKAGSNMYLFGAICGVIFGAVFIWTGAGLFGLKNTARKITVYLLSYITVQAIVINAIRFADFKAIPFFLFTIYNIAAIYYLTRPKVKEQFK